MKIKVLLIAFIILSGCSNNPTDSSINIFSIEDDKVLGQQVSAEIAANPQEYPVLNPVQYPEAYAYIDNIRNKILNAGNVFYDTEFVWEIRIIHDDNTVNAFCTPGGYIYIYTGLLRYLDSEDQLAGVMGHEMAHADRRHTTDQLTKIYGIQFLISLLLGGDSSQIADIAQGLVYLEFSRENEEEADKYSVNYLCPTEYNAAGSAGFFEKLIADGESGDIPVFLSSHPDPGDRLTAIQQEKVEEGCTGTATYDAAYLEFLSTLP